GRVRFAAADHIAPAVAQVVARDQPAVGDRQEGELLVRQAQVAADVGNELLQLHGRLDVAAPPVIEEHEQVVAAVKALAVGGAIPKCRGQVVNQLGVEADFTAALAQQDFRAVEHAVGAQVVGVFGQAGAVDGQVKLVAQLRDGGGEAAPGDFAVLKVIEPASERAGDQDYGLATRLPAFGQVLVRRRDVHVF